ncbi:dockerin type I domain-containing protein [Planctomycetes bacterium TBK1r]|uniref:Dockerin type I repeat protein n=1 Tax=Stieleria magnilauensis TaxID=2527963 RepID=A0ABX5XUK1_9BACT|nr:Dockerin type I repeat protein [Planctomycetes bacterium TBK1r]
MSKKPTRRRRKRSLQFEAMEGRRLLAGDVCFQNVDMPADVNNDNRVSAIDALAIINHLSRSGSGNAAGESVANLTEGSVAPVAPSSYMDVNGDNLVSASDALGVINALSRSATATPDAKDASPVDVTPTADPVDPNAPIDPATPTDPADPVTPGSEVEQEGEHEGQHGDQNETDDASEAGETESNETEFVATLAGAGTESAIIKFESEAKTSGTTSELDVSVRGMAPSTSVDVIVAGVTVGQLTTDASGNGSLELSSNADDVNDIPLPANFPVVTAGTTVQVGTLSGTFALEGPETPVDPVTPTAPVDPTTPVDPATPVDPGTPAVIKDAPPLNINPVTPTDPVEPIVVNPVDPVTPTDPVDPAVTPTDTADPTTPVSDPVDNDDADVDSEVESDDDHDDLDESEAGETETEIVANLTGVGNDTAKVEFETETERGVTQNELEVSVRNFAANVTVDVTIGGVVIGQITTDANGRGELEFTSAADEPGDLPLPANLPLIEAGVTVQVGTLTGAFVARTA